MAGGYVPQWQTVYQLLLISPSLAASSPSPFKIPIWGPNFRRSKFPGTPVLSVILKQIFIRLNYVLLSANIDFMKRLKGTL